MSSLAWNSTLYSLQHAWYHWNCPWLAVYEPVSRNMWPVKIVVTSSYSICSWSLPTIDLIDLFPVDLELYSVMTDDTERYSKVRTKLRMRVSHMRVCVCMCVCDGYVSPWNAKGIAVRVTTCCVSAWYTYLLSRWRNGMSGMRRQRGTLS